MQPYHTYTGSNGKQNSVFPLEFMYLTQGEGGSTSHQGTLAMDFQGMSSYSTRMLRCPYYAPVDLVLVARPDDANHVYVYTSINQVNFIDGTIDYLTIMFNHDNSVYALNRRVNQGQEIGRTGTYGNGSATGVGDHVHIEAKKGVWEGLIQNSQGVWCMKNADHLYDLLGVDGTTLIVDGGYNWNRYGTQPTPISSTRKTKFPWVLYTRKLRNNNY